MIDFGLILARFLHYLAATTLVGVSLFPLYACLGAEPDVLRRQRRRLLFAMAILALFSGIAWFLLSAASMSGEVYDMADPDVLLAIVHATSFGTVWTWRMLIALVMMFVIAADPFPASPVGQDLRLSLLAIALLGSLAGVGHTQVEEGWADVVHVSSDAAHLLAAGSWLGGLIPLGFILLRYGKVNYEAGFVDQVLLRFSGMGYVAVGTLVGTGLINSSFLVGSVSNLLSTLYGQILGLKLALFAGMLVLAMANRFWLVPALSKIRSTASESDSVLWRQRLRRHVLGEQLLGIGILCIVSLLGTMQPAIGQ